MGTGGGGHSEREVDARRHVLKRQQTRVNRGAHMHNPQTRAQQAAATTSLTQGARLRVARRSPPHAM